MSKNKILCTIKLPRNSELHQKIRKTWDIKPIERVVNSKKVYNRKKFNIRDYED